MNYELAKELFEAGYPMSKPWKENDEYPTLSELIMACGEDFVSLINGGDSWWANAVKPLAEGGNTPEEAVARLWLALNKK